MIIIIKINCSIGSKILSNKNNSTKKISKYSQTVNKYPYYHLTLIIQIKSNKSTPINTNNSSKLIKYKIDQLLQEITFQKLNKITINSFIVSINHSILTHSFTLFYCLLIIIYLLITYLFPVNISRLTLNKIKIIDL